jgi:hypothetical protein
MTIHAQIISPTALISSPADASTYYVGTEGDVPTGTAADHAIPGGPLGRTIRNVRIFADVGAAGSAELVKAKILNITDGSDFDIGSDGFDADAVFLKADVAAVLSAGDQWCIEISTLAWGTDPSDISIEGVVYIEDNAEETVLSAALVKIDAVSDALVSDISGLVIEATEIDLISANLNSDVSDVLLISAEAALISQTLVSDISALVVAQAEVDTVSANLVSDVSDVLLISAEVATVSQTLVSDISALVLTDAEADTISANLQSDISDLVVQAASQVSDYAVQSGLIAALGDTSAIEAELDLVSAAVVALDLDAPEIVILNALLAQNPPGILSAAEVAAIRSKVTTKLSGDAGTAR